MAMVVTGKDLPGVGIGDLRISFRPANAYTIDRVGIGAFPEDLQVPRKISAQGPLGTAPVACYPPLPVSLRHPFYPPTIAIPPQ